MNGIRQRKDIPLRGSRWTPSTRRGWIAYVGYMKFPWGQAASRRVFWNAMSLCRTGRDVVVLSGSDEPSELTQLESHNGGSLKHIGMGASTAEHNPEWKKAAHLMTGGLRSTRWLSSQATLPSHVVLYGGYTPYLAFLLPWCRRHRIPLIADVVEWYETGSLLSLRTANVYLSMQHLFARCDGIIAISRYLERYYSPRRPEVIRVPPTLDVASYLPRRVGESQVGGRISLVYAGSPSAKDCLDIVIEGIQRLPDHLQPPRLTVIGPDESIIRQILGPEKPIPSFVELCGRVPQQQVREMVRSADYSVLIRQKKRSNEAGFPTKLVESMAEGTPVIANRTSDVAEHIVDGVSGFLCSEASAVAFTNALRRAVEQNPSQRVAMRQATHAVALACFDYKQYGPLYDEFLQRVVSRGILG